MFFQPEQYFLSQQISRNNVSACFYSEANGPKYVVECCHTGYKKQSEQSFNHFWQVQRAEVEEMRILLFCILMNDHNKEVSTRDGIIKPGKKWLFVYVIIWSRRMYLSMMTRARSITEFPVECNKQRNMYIRCNWYIHGLRFACQSCATSRN